MNDLDNPKMPVFVPRPGPLHDPQEYGDDHARRVTTLRRYFAKGIYFWYSFGTWLRKRDGTVPVASDFSISCRCVRCVDFFFGAVAAVFGVLSVGLGEGAAVV